MQTMQESMLEQIEQIVTKDRSRAQRAFIRESSVVRRAQCVISHDYPNTGTIYVQDGESRQTLFAVAFDFQHRGCRIKLCGTPFANDSRAERSRGAGPIGTGLPDPHLSFESVGYADDARIHEIFELIDEATAQTLAGGGA